MATMLALNRWETVFVAQIAAKFEIESSREANGTLHRCQHSFDFFQLHIAFFSVENAQIN